jgi:long-chain acyl-CoA synthetase
VPDAAAVLVDDRVECDYRTLVHRVAARAGALRARGVKPGDRVAIYSTNRPDYLEVLYAIWWCGASAVPLSSMLHPREVAELLYDCAAVTCFVSEDVAGGLDGALPIVLLDAGESRAARGHSPIECAERAPEDAAWIFYTSGTTGTPKGATLSHGNLLAMAMAYLADVEWVDERSGLLHLALQSHASGLFALPFVARGAAQVVPTRTDPDHVAALLTARERLTFFAPPIMMRRLSAAPAIASAPVERMGTLLVGAAPVYADDLRAAMSTFGQRIWNGYGQGETPCTITAMSPRAMAAAAAAGDEDLLRSVGVPRIATQVRVVDPDDRPLPDGEVGEVVVAGPTVMSGYLNRPDATAETLRGGWLHTGDLGCFVDGHLTLLDRSKDLVISGGANIYPREVEDVLLQEPTVADIAVIGVPDDEWGERVVAVVVPADGCTIDPARLDAYCLSTMARYKRPKEYVAVDSLPRNGAGKVLKRELREQLAARP